MRKNPVKEKLRNGEPTFGTWLSLGNFLGTRILSRMGWDWLTLDIEHGAFDWSQAEQVFAAVADAGCVPLARVPEGSHHYIKRVLDAGAWGIVVPMVDTVEQAKAAIAAAKFPPEGTRSVGGGSHNLNFVRRQVIIELRPMMRPWSSCKQRARRGSPMPRPFIVCQAAMLFFSLARMTCDFRCGLRTALFLLRKSMKLQFRKSS